MPYSAKRMPVFLLLSSVLFFSVSSVHASVRLGVMIVVDQMRPEYLDRSDLPDGGFRRLRLEGAVFTQARHLHIPTETAPGHAAISTGRSPAVHGIVGNDWYDRVAGADVNSMADAAYGIGPEHLRGPTLADALKAEDARARVFAVSGKDRGAIILGGRKADIALWFDRYKGEFTTSSYYKRPLWLAAFNAELKRKKLLPVKDARVPKHLIASPAYDEALDLLIAELVARERVGRGPGADLLAVSFSGTDLVGHTHGLEVAEMDAQLKSLDAITGRLLRRLEKASGGSLALAFSSDHGAIPAPEDESGKALGVKRLDWVKFGEVLEKTLQKKWPLKDARWILSNQIPHLYLNRRGAESLGLEWHDFLARAAKLLSGVEGLAGVHLPDAQGTPFSAALRSSYDPGRSGDLMAIMAENVLLHGTAPGTSHGTPWGYDARVPLVFWGRGVRAGRVDAPSATVDLAPTLGRLLGVDYPAGEGAALRTEALAAPR
ncbi:MAG: alkaline phosphatase family protein [Elusimicrobiota bacterium]|nr:alkaline phosphatase family protein [Elusimicrobiota bacterium]